MPKTSVMSSSTSSSSSASTTAEKTEPRPKVDPSFKSKRYRDKLRTEVKALEGLLPVDRTSLSRKLDSQTVFRLVIAFLRTQGYFQALGFQNVQTEATDDVVDDYQENAQDVQSINDLVNGFSCLQVLDGFLLVLTADGTIFYVSSNVLQYLGYNQVDLMHRCLYSIVHSDDMFEMKMVMETTLGHLVVHPGNQADQNQDGIQNLEECNVSGRDTCKPVSFVCRMRCFSGSSIGYLKMHCSGKMVHVPNMPKSKRFSSNIVLLFCNPFMLRASEFTIDLQKNVFWSKHDLDLNIKEMDKKGADIIGFEPDELEKRSFYILIHPEDLAAVAACHKMLIESTEVQTVYFRLQAKGGEWVWLTSRGKMISRNSKKFSIAFSHCPLREEDSTYIQQEAALRRRHAIHDLICIPQSQHVQQSKNQHMDQKNYPCTPLRSKKADSTDRYHPYYTAKSDSKCTSNGSSICKMDAKKEDCNLVDTSCVLDVICPSAWHAMSDRHSPVLPSSHVAHKISQREKQIQFQEFCRRQHLETDSHRGNGKINGMWDGNNYGAVQRKSLLSVGSGDDGCSLLQSSTCSSSSRMAVSMARVPEVNGLPLQESQITAGFGHYIGAPQGGSAAYTTSWPGCTPSSCADSAGGACLTPSRSPLQSRLPHAYGAFTSQSFQPHMPTLCESSRAQNIPCTNMPPSPPPSPPNSFFRHAPVYHYFQPEKNEGNAVSYVGFCNYRPEWSSGHACIGYPQMQSAPYTDFYSVLPAVSTASCTIAELQKTTEKFLQVKEEASCDEGRNAEVHLECQTAGLYCEGNSKRPDWYYRPSWSYDGHPTAQKSSESASGPGLAVAKPNLPASSEEPISKHTNRSLICSNRPTTDSQIGHKVMPQYYVENFGTNTSSHHANFLTVPSSSFGSPPPYPYPFYHQAGHHPRQYPVPQLYGSPNLHVKVVDIQRPVADQPPLDLPSIGSFLEYLNEV